MRSYTNLHQADRMWFYAARILGLLMIWFGAMRFFPFAVEAMGRLLEKYPWLPANAGAYELSVAVGGAEIAVGLLLLLAPSGRWLRFAGLAAALFWSGGVFLLVGPAAWVQEPPYGGFPVIGSGQTLLKHVGIAALAIGVAASAGRGSHVPRSVFYGLWLGQLLVLTWIGLMKFTSIEATGVEHLMRTSPLFSWLYRFFTVQGSSNVIGVIELSTAALIALWPWWPRVARWGLLAAIATYALTNSFLVTLPAWQADYGFPFVGSSGQFLLKDLVLLIGAWILLRSRRQHGAA